MADSGKSWGAWCKVALLGAVVAHPLVFLLAFLVGAIFGASTTNFVRRSPTAYGVHGGQNAVEMLLRYYFAVIPALVVSAVGAGVASAIRCIVVGRFTMRAVAIIVTGAFCVGAGATAGPVAYASVLHWPLSETNLHESVGLGLRWGCAGAIVSAVAVAAVQPKNLWVTAVIAVAATWLTTFAGACWLVLGDLAW